MNAGTREQDAAFDDDLQVVVVSFLEVLVLLRGLIRRHRGGERIQPGTHERKVLDDRRAVAPDVLAELDGIRLAGDARGKIVTREREHNRKHCRQRAKRDHAGLRRLESTAGRDAHHQNDHDQAAEA